MTFGQSSLKFRAVVLIEIGIGKNVVGETYG